MIRFSFLPVFFGLLCAPVAAQSYMPNYSAPRSGADTFEARFGVSYHGVILEEDSVDINAEIATPRIGTPSGNKLYDFFFRPRFNAGVDINTEGYTNALYAGLLFETPVWRSVFFELGFGALLHDGETGFVVPPDRLALGCSLLFHETFALGYDVSENWRVMVRYEHASNAGLCDRNAGLNNLGLLVGYKF